MEFDGETLAVFAQPKQQELGGGCCMCGARIRIAQAFAGCLDTVQRGQQLFGELQVLLVSRGSSEDLALRPSLREDPAPKINKLEYSCRDCQGAERVHGESLGEARKEQSRREKEMG